jgi:hypothetical protein
MNESEVLRIINKQIDGEISETEMESLNHILESDENLRRQYQNMKKTVDTLERIPEIDPPSSLTNDIMSTIDAQRYQRTESLWQKINQAISDFMAPRGRVAMAFVSGLVIGACCIGLISNYETLSNTDVSATIGADHINNMQHYTMQSTNLNAELSLEKLPSQLIYQAKIQTDHSFVMLIEFDSPGYYLVKYESISGVPVFIESENRQIQLTANSGSEVRLIFNGKNPGDDGLRLTITSQDETLNKTILF